MHLTPSKWHCILALALVALVGLAACGQTTVKAPSPHTSFSNVPVGMGANPEPGTNGQPQPAPNGHSESIIASGNVSYVGSDNGTVYALGASTGSRLWQRHVGGQALVYVVADGVLYVTTSANGAVDPPATPGAVYALDASTGAVRWQFRPGASELFLIVSAGVVYAGTGAEGNTMTIFALRATTGALLWRYTVTTALPGLLGVVNGLVYARQVTDYPQDPPTTAPSILAALDAGTGKVLWQATIAGSDGVAAGVPVESNGILYLATTNGALYALNAATGQRFWRHAAQSGRQLPPIALISPVLASGFVYIGDEQGIAAYRASDGTLQWQFKGALVGPFLPQPAMVNGVVYVSAGMQVAALRAADGAVLWERPAQGQAIGPLLITDDLVINTGQPIYALRASDGTPLWQSSISPSGVGHEYGGTQEAVAGGVVYIGSDDGVVHALRAADGSALWHYGIPELAIPTPPVYSAYVTFNQAISYQQALEIVTNLGLQTYLQCTVQWANSDTASTFSQGHALLVQATVSSAPLWMGRLLATPGVASAQSSNGPISCPLMRQSNAPPYLRSQQGQVTTDLQVAFASTVSYASALETVNGLGFRLANPCYEQARARGSKPTWQPMSQADTYAKTEQLVLATTGWNATSWLDQLRALPSVSQITTSFTTTC